MVTDGPPVAEKFRAAHLVAFLVEHVDEGRANDLALGFRVADPGQPREEHVAGIGMDQGNIVVVAEQRNDLFAFTAAHQPGIDKDAGQLLANRFMDQHGGDTGIHAA